MIVWNVFSFKCPFPDLTMYLIQTSGGSVDPTSTQNGFGPILQIQSDQAY